MPKRKSVGGGGEAKKSAKQSGGKANPEKLQFLTAVMPAGGPSKYLEEKYPDQDSLLTMFGKTKCESFPCLICVGVLRFDSMANQPRKVYATAMDKPCLVRPWMLSYRQDFGVSGFMDPEIGQLLLELVMSEGFASDPDRVATEKLNLTPVPKAYLDSEYQELPNLKSDLLPPFSCAYIKGWKRGVTLLTALQGIKELGLEESVQESSSSWRTNSLFENEKPQHGQVLPLECLLFRMVRIQLCIWQCLAYPGLGHGLSFGTVFHNLRIEKCRCKQEWASATSVAKAFQLGKLESEAVFNLRCKVAPDIVATLSDAVRRRGLTKLLTHELLARDLLNLHFSSGSGSMEQWKEELRNREGNKLATCLAYVSRVEMASKSEQDKREQELAATVRAADLTQLVARLESDLKLLAPKENSSNARAIETSKDMKYLHERQLSLDSVN
eukprot:s3014_g3.t1